LIKAWFGAWERPRELRMTSVAEGVESAAVYNFLMANGCEAAQGVFISRPVSLDEFKTFAAADHNFDGSQIGRIHQTVHNVLYHRKSLFDVVFCDRLGAKACLPSIMTPNLNEPIEKSRIGIWYFGVGQQLAGLPAFDALQQPLQELYKLSHDVLDKNDSYTSDDKQKNVLFRMDGLVNQIVPLLHSLESALLLQQSELKE